MQNTEDFKQLTKTLRLAILQNGAKPNRQLYYQFLDELEKRIKNFRDISKEQEVTVLTDSVLKIKRKIAFNEYEEQNNFMGYCRKIAYNTWIKLREKEYKYQAKFVDSTNLEHIKEAPKTTIRHEETKYHVQIIRRIFRGLKKKEQNWVQAYYIHGATAKELGEENNMKTNTMKQRLFYLKSKILKNATIYENKDF